ncbi:uncharacterized protein LOC115210823 [Argonauta hians]
MSSSIASDTGHDDGKCSSKQSSKSTEILIETNEKLPSSPQNKANVCLEEVLLKVNQCLKRLSTPDDIDMLNTDCYNDIKIVWENSQYNPNIHIRKSVALCLYQSNFVKIFKNIWLCVHQVHIFHKDNIKQWRKLKKSLSVLWNTCDINSEVCQDVCDNGLISILLHALVNVSNTRYSEDDKKQYYVKAILGIMHNVVRYNSDGRLLLRECGGVRALQHLFKSDLDMIRAKSLIVLSYVVDETESELLNSNSDLLSFILDIFDKALNSPNHFSSKYGMCVKEILRGLFNLSASDVNKVQLVQNGILTFYVRLLQEDNLYINNALSEEEILLVINGLWALSFNGKNKALIQKEPGCLEALRQVITHGTESSRHAARGIFWELQSSNVYVPCTPDNLSVPHIMISYQWDVQPIMLKIKEKLDLAGYKVWMDVEHMRGSTLEAMALAVERSAVVLIGVSQSYKDSPNCRTESEYVFRLRKDIIPLMVQKNYIPDGWLGMLIGTRLYFDFSTAKDFDIQLPRLFKEIGSRGILTSKDEPLINAATANHLCPSKSTNLNQAYMLWNQAQVNKWLESCGLKHIRESFSAFNGELLEELYNVQQRAPEFFYKILQTDFKMNLTDILKFSKELSHLESKR